MNNPPVVKNGVIVDAAYWLWVDEQQKNETCPHCGGWVHGRSESCGCRNGKRLYVAKVSVAAIGLRVRQCRQGMRLSLDELSKRCGRSKTMLWQLETGRSEPGAETLARLSEALQVSIDWLVLGI